MSTRMVRVHFVQSVPAPQASLTCRTVRAPLSTTSAIVPLVTARHRHTHTPAHRSDAIARTGGRPLDLRPSPAMCVRSGPADTIGPRPDATLVASVRKQPS